MPLLVLALLERQARPVPPRQVARPPVRTLVAPPRVRLLLGVPARRVPPDPASHA